jgi:hypothetical protein
MVFSPIAASNLWSISKVRLVGCPCPRQNPTARAPQTNSRRQQEHAHRDSVASSRLSKATRQAPEESEVLDGIAVDAPAAAAVMKSDG